MINKIIKSIFKLKYFKKMQYKIFLDDKRNHTDPFYDTYNELYLEKDWVVIRNYESFVERVEQYGLPYLVSFDYDLSREKDGLDCAKWLKEYCDQNKKQYPDIEVHSGWPGIKSEFHKIFV